jgi:hypothetical protein
MTRRRIHLRFEGDLLFAEGEPARLLRTPLKLGMGVRPGTIVTVLRPGTRRPDKWLVRVPASRGKRAREFVVPASFLAKLDVVDRLATLDMSDGRG